ncbi:hypothetical protein LJB42_000306 [Komagataella kurtzmanii]|nr:hypothetical protein LJB42_000306 [Komagataella kurtzmanii]
MEDFGPVVRYGPITALQFKDGKLYSGNGPSIEVYDYVTGEMVGQRPVFKDNRVHGIQGSNDGTSVAIHGVKSLLINRWDHLFDEERTLDEFFVSDWIISTSFSYDNSLLYVLTAHNAVLLICLNSLQIIETLHCNERSILYSGSIRVLPDKVIVCAGTVMSGILLWDLSSRSVIHNLKGHEGSIFGVQADTNGELVVSCSDDRSVKVWDLESGECLMSGWGHGARIWSLQFYDNNTKVFSASEDCTARSWAVDREKGELKCLKVFDTHYGKHIWSAAISQDELIAATGGADGRIRLVDLNSKLARKGFQELEFSVDSISKSTGSPFAKDEILKGVAEFDNLIVAVTSKGKILQKTGQDNWILIEQDPSLEKFVIMKSQKERRLVLLCNNKGYIRLLQFDPLLIQDIVIPNSVFDHSKSNISNVLIAGYDEHSVLICTETPNPKEPFLLTILDLEENIKFTQHTLIKPDMRFVSSCISFDIVNKWLLIGSRYTTIALYDISTLKNDLEPLKVWKKYVPGDTISSLKVLSSIEHESLIILTTRDGWFYYIQLSKSINSITDLIVQENRIQKGFVEGCFIHPSSGDLLLYGFKSSLFFLWNETKQLEVFNEICGGPHRLWQFNIRDATTNDYSFIYTRASVLNVRHTGSSLWKGDSILRQGTHGREVRDISISSSSVNGKRLLLTGSEDTTLKLSSIDESSLEITQYWTLRKHVSGLQKAKIIHQDKELGLQYALSSAAREEFFVWLISETIQGSVPLISNYATLPPSSEIHPDLRIMDFDVMKRADESGKVTGFLISTVYSDSTIKVWDFSITKREFRLVIDGKYTTICIWNVKFLQLGGNLYLLTAGTDGHVCIWDITYSLYDSGYSLLSGGQIQGHCIGGSKLGELLVKQQIHQSGIKAMDFVQASSTELLIITGGDDNALGLLNLTFTPEKSTLHLSIVDFKDSAATSTITGLNVIDSSTFFTTSVDQVVRIWKIDQDKLVLQAQKRTAIADTGCSDVCNISGKNHAVIGGAGLSLWGVN